MQIDKDLFTAKMYHGLKSLLVPGDKLPPRFLEFSLCDAFGMTPKGDGNYYADGVKYNVPTDTTPINIQASIKSIGLSPDTRKDEYKCRDFQTHPVKFLGYQFNHKQGKVTNGLQIIQRRQAIEGDDLTATPEFIGEHSIKGFNDNLEESSKKFDAKSSYEIIIVHGYNFNLSKYLANVYWQPYKSLDHTTIKWQRDQKAKSVVGYSTINIEGEDREVKVCERFNGNSKRLATIFAEYKNPSTYQNSAQFSMPLPKPWAFDKDTILKEMQ
jgi:hypothetical protein